MGTRSNIIVKRASGGWHRIYCHWDGYVSHNGRILAKHYNSQKRAEALVNLGDLSALGSTLGRKHPFDAPRMFSPNSTEISAAYEDYQKRFGNMCLSYGRDRGEKDARGLAFETLQAAFPEPETWAEYVYVWDGAQWLVGNAEEGSQALRELSQVLLEEREDV
jgi:hypothetical protein